MNDADSAATAATPISDERPVISHRLVLLVFAVGSLAAFAAWQATGVELYVNALGRFCL